MIDRRPRLLPWLAVGIALALAVGTLMVGAGPAGRPGRARTAAETAATAVFDVAAVPTNLNPHTTAGDSAATRIVGSAIWPQAYEVGPGLTVTPDSAVVSSAEVVGLRPQTVVYHLDPAAVWSNGTPIRANAFSYLWHEELAHGGGGGYQDIASVTGSDGGTTVTVVFRTPDANWTSLFDDLVPPQVGTAYGWRAGFSAEHLASLVFGGPWVVSSWVPGQRIELSRNPRWWGPRPALAHIVLEATSNGPAAVSALAAGHVQALELRGMSLGLLDAVSSLPTVRSTVVEGTEMLQLVFNTRVAPLDQVAVRQALGHLVDPSQLVTDLVDPLDPGAAVQGSFLVPTSQGGYVDDGTAYQSSDVALADRLLTGAGVVFDQHGEATLAGAPLVLTLVWAQGDPWSALVAPAIAASLEAAGIGVDSEPVATTSLRGAVPVDGPWDLALVDVPGQPDPASLGPEYSTTLGPQGAHGIVDWSGYDSPTIDSLFAQAQSQLNVTDAQATEERIDDDLWVAMPALPLFTTPELVAWAADVSGLSPDPGGDGLLWQSTGLTLRVPAQHAGTLAAAHRPPNAHTRRAVGVGGRRPAR